VADVSPAALTAFVNFLWLWAPVLVQMALIFGASSLSDPGPLPASVSDKTLHVAAYAVLSFLMIRAIAGGRIDGITWRRALLALVLTVLYGASDEFHQRFTPGRTPDLLDLRADALGACGGVIAWYALRLLRWAGPRAGATPRQ
jgi:VanZ family protein